MMNRYLLFLIALLVLMPAGYCLSSGADNAFILPQYSKRISLDFKDADIRDVLKVFSQQIGSNFIITDKVKEKKVTVFLDKVPVEDALAQILVANGLVYRYDQGSNIFMVDPKEEVEKSITRVYPLRYATVPSAKIFSTFAISEEGSSSSASEPAAGAGGITDSILPVLTKAGKIAVDARTNSLIITDVESNFIQIERTIGKLDVPIPQVLIQVEMIDTSKQVLDEMGVKFGNTLYGINGLGGRNFFFPLSNDNVMNKADNLYAATYTSGSFSGLEFSAVLQFLRTNTDTKSLARPRILTMDNQTAQIKISANEVVGVTITTSTTGGPDTETAERMETGVILTVTPQVNLLSGDILMAVSPKVIDVKKSSIGDFMDPETRGAKVIMRVRDGETIVMGGLLRSSKEMITTKVPLFGDLPFVGRAFRHKKQTDKDRELLIFITPNILSPEGASLPGKGPGIDMKGRESSTSGRSQKIISELDRVTTRKGSR